jgi:hypothetical protein
MIDAKRKEISRKLILEALKKFTGLFNKSPNAQALELYAEMLAESYEFKQVTWALTEFVKSGSPFFPSCGEIFGKLKVQAPSKDEKANAIVAELFQAIKDFSQYCEIEMIETLSEDARLVLSSMGGTSELRNSSIDNLGTTRAQLRDLAKSVIASKENKIKTETLERIGINTGARVEFKKMDLAEYLPSEAL